MKGRPCGRPFFCLWGRWNGWRGNPLLRTCGTGHFAFTYSRGVKDAAPYEICGHHRDLHRPTFLANTEGQRARRVRPYEDCIRRVRRPRRTAPCWVVKATTGDHTGSPLRTYGIGHFASTYSRSVNDAAPYKTTKTAPAKTGGGKILFYETITAYVTRAIHESPLQKHLPSNKTTFITNSPLYPQCWRLICSPARRICPAFRARPQLYWPGLCR